MATTKITIRDSGELRPLAGLRFNITTGIHAPEAAEPHPSGMTVGETAMLHEFGADKIPARKWMRTWCEKYQRQVAAEIRLALIPMARRLEFNNPGALTTVASRMKSTMRSMVLSGWIRPANAPQTLAKKAPETRPLLETGQMVGAVEAEIKAPQLGWNSSTRGGMGP